MSERVTVLTIPPPTVNGPLHVGHLSGPYLAADIAARAARARGEWVLVSTGLDIHQTYVPIRAEREGVSVQTMLAGFRAEITETYRLAGIEYDNYIDTFHPDHDATIDALVGQLIAGGAAPMTMVDTKVCIRCERTLVHGYVVGRCSCCGAKAWGGACEGCGAYTSAQDLLDPRCSQCDDPASSAPVMLPVLHLEDYRSQLTAMWLRADMPDRVRRMLAHQLAVGLPEIPVAYPGPWGVEVSGTPGGLRVDAFLEAGLMDFYGIARAIDPNATGVEDFVAAWGRVDRLWNFHGIDNACLYALYWPAAWAALGLDPLPQAGMSVNEFYRLDGQKFSTSRNHVIWANDVLAKEDPAILRLYLAWDRPDRYGSDFTWESYEAFRDRVAPLLDGTATPRPLPDALAQAELDRGMAALRLNGFDPALAARCLLALLEAGRPGLAPLASALTGRIGAVTR